MIGKKFGFLTIVADLGTRKGRGRVFLCRCDCGRELTVRSEVFRPGVIRSCLFCRAKAHPHDRRNPNITDATRKLERNLEYPEWMPLRAKILVRDSYTCVKCGKTTGSMHVHHVLPWKFFPEFRLHSDNLVTFCIKCHKAFHSTYGQKSTPANVLSWVLDDGGTPNNDSLFIRLAETRRRKDH